MRHSSSRRNGTREYLAGGEDGCRLPATSSLLTIYFSMVRRFGHNFAHRGQRPSITIHLEPGQRMSSWRAYIVTLAGEGQSRSRAVTDAKARSREVLLSITICRVPGLLDSLLSGIGPRVVTRISSSDQICSSAGRSTCSTAPSGRWISVSLSFARPIWNQPSLPATKAGRGNRPSCARNKRARRPCWRFSNRRISSPPPVRLGRDHAATGWDRPQRGALRGIGRPASNDREI